MSSRPLSLCARSVPAALLVATAALLFAPAAGLASGGGVGLGGASSASAPVSTVGSGGAPIGGLDPLPKPKPKPKPKAKTNGAQKPLHGVWLGGVDDHRVLAGARGVVRRAAGRARRVCRASTGSTGSTPPPASRWRARGSASTAACTTSTRSADGGWVTAAGRSTDAFDGWSRPARRTGAPAATGRTRAARCTFPLSAGGWSAGTGRHVCADSAVSPSPPGAVAAAALLPVDRGRSERDPARQPCLHPGLQARRPRRLVHRPGHRRRDQRPPRRRVPQPAGQSRRRAVST